MASGKLPPEKFPPIQQGEALVNPPQKIPTWKIPTHVFKYGAVQ